jgi:RecA-family ATPase
MLVLRTIAEAEGDPLPPPSPIIGGGLLNENGALFITGPEKVGKSWLAINMAAAMASGSPFLRWQVEDPLRVLYLQLENNPSMEEERAFKVTSSLPLITKQNFYHGSWVDYSGTQDQLEQLLEVTEKIRPDVLVIDPLYLFYYGAERDNDDVRNWITNFYRPNFQPLTRALVMVHHHAKDSVDTNGRRPSQKMSGANSWGRWAESVLTLSGRNPSKVKVDVTARASTPTDPFYIHLNPDTFLFEEGTEEGNKVDLVYAIVNEYCPLPTAELVVIMKEQYNWEVSERTASRALSELVEAERIVSKRVGRNITYSALDPED